MANFVLNEITEKELVDYFRVSTRLDRAVELVDFVEQVAPDIYLVQSASKPVRYMVDVRAMTCECPDWTYRGSVNGIACKHIMAAYLIAHRKNPQ
jgi:hypothetical protein